MLQLGLAALQRQTDRDFEILVVSQGASLSPSAAILPDGTPVRVIADDGRGLSRARNLAWRATDADWVGFIDDDCELASDWVATLKRIVAQDRQSWLVAGQVAAVGMPAGPYLPCGVVRVRADRHRRGRWRRPLSIGGGAGVAIRREKIAALGGWDERLGAGSPWFPAAEDEDFNYRLLRAGGTAFASPALRASHHQWREPGDLIPLFRDYMTGRGGTAMKHLCSRDKAGGVWLLGLAFLDCLILLASAARFGMGLRLRIGYASLRGLSIGIRRGLCVAW